MISMDTMDHRVLSAMVRRLPCTSWRYCRLWPFHRALKQPQYPGSENIAMKRVLPLVALLAFLFILDWQQRWRADSLIEDQGDLKDCRRESPCTLRSVEADMCSILSENRSFLGRAFRPEIRFEPDRPCTRGGRYAVDYWMRET